MMRDFAETDAWLHDQGYSYGGASPIRNLTMIEIKQLRMGRSRHNETQSILSDSDKSKRDLIAMRNQKVRRRRNGN